MISPAFQHSFGWATWLLALIPLVLLVRLLVRRSRWSILRISLVSLLGTGIVAVWLAEAGRSAGMEDALLGGELGRQMASWLTSMTSPLISFFIIQASLLAWVLFAGMDAVTATARFIINKPYIKEIVKVKEVVRIRWVEKERPTERTTTKGSTKNPVKGGSGTTTKPTVTKQGDGISSIDEAPDYRIPSPSILQDGSGGHRAVPKSEIEHNIAVIRETLSDHHVQVSDIQAIPGPTVTLYKIYPAKGVRVAAIRNLTDDVSVALKAGKVLSSVLDDCVGIEVANRQRSSVSMRELIESEEFRGSGAALPVVIGREVTGEVKVFDLADAPHLLVAGATGQGKSVGLNVLIASLLYAKRPSELKLIFIDPKKTEFSKYSRLHSHYLALMPDSKSQEEEKARAIIKDPKDADTVLRSLCMEMDQRYSLLEAAGTPDIKGYNSKYIAHQLNPQNGHRYLPYIVTIIDEYSQLVLGKTASPEGKANARSIMSSIISIAQMGRACGIHLVIATQTPRKEVISGLIKANFPMSIAFKTKTDVDSRVILDEPGAEKLLGKGDMLITKNADMDRVQCGYISSSEIDALTARIESQKGYRKSFNTPYYLPEVEEEGGSDGEAVDMKKLDDRFEEAARLVVMSQRGSTSDLQRKMSIGYAKAGRIMDQLEAAGIVGPQNGAQKREVLIDSLSELDALLKKLREE